MKKMSNSKIQMPNEAQSPNVKKKYDLEERTAQFGERIIEFARTLPQNPINNSLISWVVRSGTSIGANYMPDIFHHLQRRGKEIWHLGFGI